jgi:hypothetical protein
MRQRIVLLATITLWAIVVTFLGYRRMFVTWHLGSAWTFFFESWPLALLALVLLLGLEILFFGWLDRSRRP